MPARRAGLGSSEFTQFFNHSHLWKLQLIYSRMLCH